MDVVASPTDHHPRRVFLVTRGSFSTSGCVGCEQSLCTFLLITVGQVLRIRGCEAYSPECVEEVFSEVGRTECLKLLA